MKRKEDVILTSCIIALMIMIIVQTVWMRERLEDIAKLVCGCNDTKSICGTYCEVK